MKKNPLTARVALITGAARRIGAEITRHLHKTGMNVILHYNTSEVEARQLCQTLNEQRPNSAHVLRADLLDILVLEGKTGLVAQAAQIWNRLDVLVNNASRFYRTPLGRVTDYAWEDLIHNNLKAPFFLAQAAAPYLAASQGTIINITDIHAERPLRDYSVYCIAKGGLTMMTKVLAKELGSAVRVNGVAPGPVLWPEGENQLSELEKQKIIDRTILHKPGSAKEIAKAVLFLVQDANYITGHIINVDGGRLLYG
jgi:pteridine reductase